MKIKIGNVLLVGIVVCVLVYVLLPLVIVIGISFNPAERMDFPPTGFSLRWYEKIFGMTSYIDAFYNTLIVGIITALVAAFLGLVSAHVTTRHNFRGKDLLETVLMSPILLPSMLTGISLLILLSRFVLIGTLIPILIGHLVITYPFTYRMVRAAFPGLHVSYEEAATVLGAGKPYTFLRITIPMMKPAIVSALLFAFVRSFTDSTVALFLSTSRVRTIPVVIFHNMYTGADPSVAAISSFFIVVAIISILILGRVAKLEMVV